MFRTLNVASWKCFMPPFPGKSVKCFVPPTWAKKTPKCFIPPIKTEEWPKCFIPRIRNNAEKFRVKKVSFHCRSTCLICCSVTLQIFLSHSPYHCSYVSHTVHTKACILDSAIYIVRHTVMNKLWGLRSTWNCYNKVRVPVSYLYFIVVWTFPSDDDRCKITKTSSLLLYCIRSYTSSFI